MKARLNLLVMLAVAALAALAIARELQKPPAERRWQGLVAGVPYNFNRPTWDRLRAEYWNPQSDRILSPHAVGMGWGINVAALVNRAQTLIGSRG
jgi:hypothetical protein